MPTKEELKEELFFNFIKIIKKELEQQSDYELEEMRENGELYFNSVGDGSREISDECVEKAFELAINKLSYDGLSMHADYSPLDDVANKIMKSINLIKVGA